MPTSSVCNELRRASAPRDKWICKLPRSMASMLECSIYKLHDEKTFVRGKTDDFVTDPTVLPTSACYSMSQIHMFMNRQDTHEFVEWLIASFGLTFTEEWSYDLPLPSHRDSEKIMDRAFGPGHHRRFALTHPGWSPHPFSTSHIVPTSGSTPFYSLLSRYGGPSFDFIVPRVATTDSGEPFIVSGMFSDYASYYIDRGCPNQVRRPAQMTEIWRHVQSYLRRHGKLTVGREHQRVGPFVLRHALTDYVAGTWLRIGSDHYEPR